MNKRVKKWVDALRSDDYKQATGKLKSNNGYCCIGVACDLINKDKWIIEGSYFSYDGHIGYMPPKVANLYKIKEKATSKLVELNDGKKYTFKQIADYIVKNQTWLFEK